MRCWYFSLIRGSLTNFITVWSSTRMLQVEPYQIIKCYQSHKDWDQKDIIQTFIIIHHKLVINLTGHSIIWLAPSSTIFIVRYSVQQEVQYRCPHSKPAIILKEKKNWYFKCFLHFLIILKIIVSCVYLKILTGLGRLKKQISQS